MNPSDRGTWAEMIVAADLLALGYHPFRAISPGAPCDFLILADEIVLRIEVRTISTRTIGSRHMTNWHNSNRADHGAYVDRQGCVAYSPPLAGCSHQAVRSGGTGITIERTMGLSPIAEMSYDASTLPQDRPDAAAVPM